LGINHFNVYNNIMMYAIFIDDEECLDFD